MRGLCIIVVQDSHATISAKPIIKHHIGDVTRFMPTALKIKRDGAKKGPGKQGMLLNLVCILMFCTHYVNYSR